MSVTFSVLSALSFILSIAACLFAARRATQRPELQGRWRSSTDLRLASLETSRDELSATLADLANRVKMMRVRTAVNHVQAAKGDAQVPRSPDDEPDPKTEPDRWREWMNARLARKRLGL